MIGYLAAEYPLITETIDFMLGFRKPKDSNEPAGNQKTGLVARLREGLARTRDSLTGGLTELVTGGRAIDAGLLEEIETTLLMADVGIEATHEIMDYLTEMIALGQLKNGDALMAALHKRMQAILQTSSHPLEIPDGVRPFVILMVGINGAGKTTTIGKLAHRFKQQGKQVMLAAGDTFRAAAVEQLQTWGERNDIPVIAQQQGADAASVLFDALQSATARNMDILIADTAGRLHTQSNLMEELKKIKRVMGKVDANVPHEIMLVVDAGTGQNALNQAREFNEAIGLTGITLTKLDGTAKGGIVFAIAKKTGIPIRFIGVGEGIENLREFDAQEFVDALFATNDV